MPLIFAIDSDKRQSAQLASLLRSHVDADLVQSATVLDGIGVLQGRIPDLVLTSSLLSPRDESALANHMRELGARAAHVHTLTIPVLAAARKASKKRPSGVLGALRREKGGEVEVEGCQPEVFAKEVRIYLERAVDERAGTGDGMDTEPSAPQPDPAVTDLVAAIEDEPSVEPELLAQAPEPEVVPEPELPAPDALAPGDLYLDRPDVIAHDTLLAQPPAVVADAFAPPETRVPVVDMSTFDDLDALAAQLAAPADSAPPAAAVDPFEQFFVPQTQALAEPAPFTEVLDAGVDDDDEVGVEPAPAEIRTVASDTWFERMNAAVQQETPVKPAPLPAPDPVFSWIDNQTVSSLSDVLSRVRANDSDAQQPPLRSVPAISQAPAPVDPVVPVEAVEPEPAMISIPATARPEIVVDLVLPPAAPFLDPEVLAMFGAAAHRAGLDALESLSRTTRTAGDKAVPALPVPGPAPERSPRVLRESKAERRSRRKGPKPVQDEWGMYDPNQCGPAALFDEDAWNEVEADEKPARRPRAS